jgi:hypothetical protein
MFYAGYADMWRVVQKMALRMPDVDAIVGVPVSGLAPAGMLSAVTGIKCVPLEAVPDGVNRLLVLEDASGFAKFRQQKLGQAPGREVCYGAVYACDAAADLDLVGCIAPKPRVFSWNLYKSNRSRRIAYDLDGVLCRNPTADQVDYGLRYTAFIESTRPLRCVRSRLGWIVTGRMERYRAVTEAWLGWAGIRYGELVMAENDQQHTMEAHAKHKADWYAAHPECLLFVESHPRQAARIAELTGRPVVCAETEQAWNTAKAQTVSGKRNPRIIYTISTGDYKEHAPSGYKPPDGWDYRVITSADCPSYLSPKQQAAWAKINGQRMFAEYEASLCIDDDMTVLRDPAPIFDGLEWWMIRKPGWISTWRHDLSGVRDGRRGATPTSVAAEVRRLTTCGIPDAANYMTGIIYRRHTPEVCRVCDEWFAWYTASETHRDQPSFAAACHVLGYQPGGLHDISTGLIETVSVDGVDYFRHDRIKANRDGVRKFAEGH